MGTLLTALSASSYAVSISVNQTSCTPGQESFCTQLTNELRETVNKDLPEVSLGKYGTGMANSQGFAYKGLGSDYSDVFDYFMVRGGAGISVEGDLSKPEQASGIGVGAALTVGLNLDMLPIDKIGPIEFEKLDVFLSFMSYSPDQEIEDTTFKGDISAFSLMARYKIIDGVDFAPGNLLSWGGVFLHTGFQRSSVEANVIQKIKNETVDVGSGQTATLTNASATFDFKTTNTSIPIEVSTFFRAGWVLSFFGGAGFDLVSGSTDVSLAASGNASGTGASSGYGATIAASEEASGDADATNFRALAGVQFNLPFFRLYTHVNKGLGNDLLGVNVGAKILW